MEAVLFEGRDLGSLSLDELAQFHFKETEISADLLETTSINTFRNQATRWHTAASNQESYLHLVKSLVAKLEVHEKAGHDPNLLVPTLPLNESLLGCRGSP